MSPTSVISSLGPGIIAAACVAAIVLFALMMERPWYGLAMLIFVTPFEEFLSFSSTYTKAAKLALTGLVMAVYFLRYAGGQKAVSTRFARYPYTLAHLILVTTACTSVAASTVPGDAAVGALQLLVVFALAWLVYSSQPSEHDAIRLMRIYVGMAALMAPFAISQFVYGYRGPMASVEQRVDGPSLALGGGFFRSEGTLGSSNSAGAFFGTACIVAILHLITWRRSRTIFAGLALVTGAAAFSSFSRGALSGMVVAIALLLPFRRSYIKWIFVSVVVATLVGIFTIYRPEGFVNLEDPTVGASSRLQAWGWAYQIFREHWWTGIGMYGYRPWIAQRFGVTSIPVHPHNEFLKTLVEQGVVGAVGYLLFVIAFARCSWLALRREQAASPRWFLAASVAGIGVCFFTQELFDAGFTVGGSSLAVMFAVMLGVQASLAVGVRMPVRVAQRSRPAFAYRRPPLVARISRA